MEILWCLFSYNDIAAAEMGFNSRLKLLLCSSSFSLENRKMFGFETRTIGGGERKRVSLRNNMLQKNAKD